MSSINRENANPPPASPVSGGIALDGGDLHVLRLCLDLQLDALLLTVGAAANVAQVPEPP
jgi:hypothetical protein